jgi:N-acetylglucosamine malate deacetylase 1
MSKVILVVGTHPDDEVLGCGGTIARHSTSGDAVHLVIVTRGKSDIFPQELILKTRAELAAAHQILGTASTAFLDFPAPGLDSVPNYKIADAIRSHVEKHRPDVVYCPHQADIHADHKATFWATLVATRPVGRFRVPRLLCYETISETEWASSTGADTFIPTAFIDISSHIKAKVRAMACYQTQLKQFPETRSLQALEALARWRGATVGVEAAEAFSLVREIVS